jgi:SAM-dependent methyltransferase
VQFQVADAYAPGLPSGTFDLAYCRLVLMHLTRPLDALRAMKSLVKPGGTVLCEEMDLGCWLCDPLAEAMSQFFRLNIALGERRGENFQLGASLHALFRQAGFARPEAAPNFPVALRGEVKRLLWMTFVEFAPELVREGLATQAEVDRTAAGLKTVADDDTTLFGLPLVMQVWGVK